MKIKKSLGILLLCWLMLVACSRLNGGEETAPPTAIATATITPTTAPQPTATTRPSPTPTATPESPTLAVEARDQVVDNDGQVIIDQVLVEEAGWVAIHADENGEAGEVLGYSPIVPGENLGVIVTINPFRTTETLHALLHQDEGTVGTFEYPGPDAPLRQGGTAVMTDFTVTVEAVRAELIVSDQEVTEEGLITIDRVVAAEPGYLAVFLDEAGESGQMVNYVPVQAGITENIVIPLNWRTATPLIHVALFQDAGVIDQFEPDEADRVVTIDDEPLRAVFQVFLPPDIFVLDQPVIDGTIVVERVISYGPGWLVVYFDEDGAPANIIGSSALQDGINEQVVIPVITSAVTPLLHLRIHRDTDDIGQFEFPRADPAVLYQDRLPSPATISTGSSNYLITLDQPLGANNTITVPLAVVDSASWLVIYSDAAGELGEIIGRAWLPAGINRDTSVEIDPDLTTPTLHAVLHLDGGGRQRFDYPDGVDIPLQRNRNIIQSPFALVRGR